MRDAAFDTLIAQVRAGDPEAAAELVSRHESAVRRFVRFRLVHPRMRSLFDSMDICQSVMASFFVRGGRTIRCPNTGTTGKAAGPDGTQ